MTAETTPIPTATPVPTAVPTAAGGSAEIDGHVTEAGAVEPEADALVDGELLVEDVSIDGMCGVY